MGGPTEGTMKVACICGDTCGHTSRVVLICGECYSCGQTEFGGIKCRTHGHLKFPVAVCAHCWATRLEEPSAGGQCPICFGEVRTKVQVL